MTRPRILLADDHPVVLDGLRSVLGRRYEIAGSVLNGRDLVEAAQRLKPDLIVLDVTMPLLNGIDAARQIQKSLPGMKLLFNTMHSSSAYLNAAFQAGGTGYVLKTAGNKELLDAAETILNGSIYVSPSLSSEPWRLLESTSAAPAPRLTIRQRETLQLIAEGLSAKEIAHVLTVSIKTVQFHRENIKKILGMRTTAELTKYALKQGPVL